VKTSRGSRVSRVVSRNPYARIYRGLFGTTRETRETRETTADHAMPCDAMSSTGDKRNAPEDLL
jgi:hypothetical protein